MPVLAEVITRREQLPIAIVTWIGCLCNPHRSNAPQMIAPCEWGARMTRPSPWRPDPDGDTSVRLSHGDPTPGADRMRVGAAG
jgi:hypothetical protein